MENKTDLRELLDHIDPSILDYQTWAEVGMALKYEGFPCSVWEDWSRRDFGRFHEGECHKKWRTFKRDEGVTGGTIYHLAVEHGWAPPKHEAGRILSLDDSIEYEGSIVGEGWAESREFEEPEQWQPEKELTRYLETLFQPEEIFGFVTESFSKANKDGHVKLVPANKGIYTKKVGDVVNQLKTGTIEDVIGSYDHKGGAWIRFNPLDGNGVNNENVTDFRYALVESDNMDLEAQNGLIRQLNLPVAVLLYSGGKSVHAIVRIEADDKKEYQERVNYLYDICKKNGMVIDTQNRNPSRLSRMPGCIRGDKKQYIIDTNIGCKSWDEWKEWTEAVNDDLPDIEDLSKEWNDLPELAPELIKGVLREGHKMLIVGPSKAGKSFDLIELCIAIAEGRQWHGWDCKRGRVLYVNLELDRASCLHRFKNVYSAAGIKPEHLHNLDIWNLRGRSVPMDKLAPKLIRRAKDRNFKAVIIDPIYKVITGDENSADQMAKFCNQFDKVCTELGAAVIYCHHHSKGSQGQKKSMDRASGSGVFARDPDALLDMIELPLTDDIIQQEVNKTICRVSIQYLKNYCKEIPWETDLSQDDLLSPRKVQDYCENKLDQWQQRALTQLLTDAVKGTMSITAWRIEGTLREFPKFKPVNTWFRYPIHTEDVTGILEDVDPEMEKPVWQMAKEARKAKAAKKKEKTRNKFEIAFTNLELSGEPVLASAVAEAINVKVDTLKGWFSDGKSAKAEYKKCFEKYIGEDGKAYIRRKSEGTDATD
ncbi:MAG TPA: DNA primase [Lachnospiraceae bacterium]|nr:DNA primase [Lachnospiraceae bacterium]